MLGLSGLFRGLMSSVPMGTRPSVLSNFNVASLRPVAPAIYLPSVMGNLQVREMRHGMRRGRLGRDPKHRWALLRNQVTDLIKHERIQTTLAKAKELRRLADEMVTLGKQGTLLARRRAGDIIRTDESIQKLFGVLARRYEDRAGGYTRVLRCRTNRLGDNAPMAYIEYIDRPGELRTSRPPSVHLPYHKLLGKAEESKDTELADYYREQQAKAVAATEARAAKIAAHRRALQGATVPEVELASGGDAQLKV